MSWIKKINKKFVQLMKNEIAQKTIASSVFIVIIPIVLTAFLFNWLFISPKTITKQPEVSAESIKNALLIEGAIFDKLGEMNSVSVYENGLTTSQSLIDSCIVGKKIVSNCNKEIAKITKSLVSEGQIENAFLYVKAAVSRDNAPLSALTKFDSIWLFFDKEEHSGQLLRSEAFYRGSSEEGFTELVYDLSNVAFTHVPYDDSAKPDSSKKGDLLKTLNSSDRHIFSSFVSTLGYGKILEMKIYFSNGWISVN